MPRPMRTVGMAVVLAAVAWSSPLAAAQTDPVATVAAPFTGKFGYKNDPSTIPPLHDTSTGHLAFDFFGDNKKVRPKIWSDTWDKPATLTVSDIRATCNDTGTTVRISVSIEGRTLGWVEYGHLLLSDTVQLGDSVTDETVLGTTARWAHDANCYQVDNASGVHTHVVLRNLQAGTYSCWVKRTAGAKVDVGRRVGLVGGNYGGTSTDNVKRKACPKNY